MISTLSIALNGLRIGADPLEIAVQGFLMEPEPTPAPFEPVGGFYLVPVWPRHEPVKRQNKKKTRDVCIEVQGCTLRTSASDIEAGEVCRVEIQGCTLSATCAEPEIAFSMSFDVIGVEEENELETYLMAQAAFKMLYEDDPDPRDFRIRSLENAARELRAQNAKLQTQISREKRLRR